MGKRWRRRRPLRNVTLTLTRGGRPSPRAKEDRRRVEREVRRHGWYGDVGQSRLGAIEELVATKEPDSMPQATGVPVEAWKKASVANVHLV